MLNPRLTLPRRPALALLVVAGACATAAEPPQPGTTRGVAPDLVDRRVMVLPVQRVVGVAGDADAELAFALAGHGPDVQWVLPARVDEALARSPGIDARTRGLPVDQFLAAEVRRVGDPLYGQIRRMAALVDADLALLPVMAAGVRTEEGTVGIRVHTALLDVRTGRVAWFSVAQGDALEAGAPAALASAMDRVAGGLVR